MVSDWIGRGPLRRAGLAFGLAAAVAAAAPPSRAGAAADIAYRADLGPVAHTMATRATVLGKGVVDATLVGKALTLSGRYVGLPSDATRAHLKMGLAAGVPGEPFADLAVTGGTSGQISGKVTLTAAQLASLKAGGLSVVVDSVKAPDGNIWGWLMPPAEAR